MKNTCTIVLLSVLAGTMFISCSPSIRITSSWMNHESMGKQKYQKVFLFVLTSNTGAKQTVENAQAKAALAEGIAVVKSSDLFSPGFLKSDPGKDAIVQKIRESGCDAVFTSALVDSKSESHYVPGTTTFYTPYPTFGYYGNFGSYYGYHSMYMYDPGYYVNDKTYYVESNLYDIASGEIIWSVQSEVYNPGTLASSSKEYAALLIDKLKDEGGLYRKK